MKWYKIPIFWIENARYHALPQSLFPSLIALSMAYFQDNFSIIYAAVALLGVLFAHLGLNLLDDYIDFKNKDSENRMALVSSGIRSRIAKCSYLTNGSATLKELAIVTWIFLTLALLIGFFIFLHRGWWILFFAGLGGLLGFFYSGRPFRLAFKGFGELIVAVVFGPLLMAGLYVAACGTLHHAIWFIAIPVGLLVSNVLYTHSIMDVPSDEKIGKMTFARLLKTTNRQLIASFCFIFLPYFILLLGVGIHIINGTFLLVFLSLPLAIMLFYLIVKFVKNPQSVVTPKWWMQPMEKWKMIENYGIEWFMIRWYMARNLLMLFSLLLLLGIFFQK